MSEVRTHGHSLYQHLDTGDDSLVSVVNVAVVIILYDNDDDVVGSGNSSLTLLL